MTNMLESIEPKSDQLNADSLTGGRTLTIKITKVSGVSGEQPIAINFENDGGKPYMPCKSMRRVLVRVWGVDGAAYVGRSMTLYCDPKVLFGGVAVGGIRISHMSHIDKEVTMALTASKTVRKPYTVKPLPKGAQLAAEIDAHLPKAGAPDISAEMQAAAEHGTEALKVFWERLKPAQQKLLAHLITDMKAVAQSADKPQDETPDPPPISNILSAG